jgi:hypothetical protein|uniref:Link domain-containing protein n=1 Tax=viral metagenome TaxID=1070528 RepID=A0A6C0BYM4_9ZZZZ
MNTDSRKELIPDIKQLLDNPIPQPESNAASSSSSELNVDPKTFMTDNSFTNPLYISVVMIGLILIVTLIVYLGGIGSTTETNSLGVETTNDNIALKVIFAIVIFLLVLYITQYVLYYYFGVDITTNLANMFKPNKDPTIDINIDKSNELPTPPPKPEPEPVDQDEVFNVRDNVYTYDDAKLVCDAYDSKLATYSQVEESYNKGGEWCNYGWSADQLALFPTQSSTYNELMKTKDHKHDCGRPGVNGGYIANPNVRFGVNCYGKKPAITKEEEEMMKNITPYPKNQKEEEIEETVNKWKNNLDDILVSPFNYGQWNE